MVLNSFLHISFFFVIMSLPIIWYLISFHCNNMVAITIKMRASMFVTKTKCTFTRNHSLLLWFLCFVYRRYFCPSVKTQTSILLKSKKAKHFHKMTKRTHEIFRNGWAELLPIFIINSCEQFISFPCLTLIKNNLFIVC